MKFQEILEACWTGYRQAGMKKKGNRQVPNCVPVEEVKTGPEMTLNDLLYTAAAKAMHQAGLEGQPMDYEEAIKKAAKIYRIPYTPSELPRLLAQRAEIDRKLAMLKQGKQIAKARRQEKLAPTPAGSEEWFKTHSPTADRIKPPTRTLEETEAELAEDLRKWFREKWVRFGPDGKIRGDCARGSSKEGKPKCLPQAKAHALGKKGRASAAAKKRREDPNPERRGAARNVATRVREQGVAEGNDIASAEVLLKRYELLTQSIRNAIDQRDYNEKFKHIEQIRDALEKHYGIDPDKMNEQGVAEGWINQDSPESLAKHFAQLYYKGLSSSDEAKLVQFLFDKIQAGELSVEQLKADIAKLEKQELDEKQDACYRKVKSRYKVWPSAYASGALVQCRKRGAANWGNKGKKK